MNEQDLKTLKNQYEDIEIPRDELETRVVEAIAEGRRESIKMSKRRNRKFYLPVAAALLAGVILPFNMIEGLAASVEDIPLLGTVANVVTFRKFEKKDDEKNYSVEIEVPEIEGLDNTSLEMALNEMYLIEGEEAYQEFLDDISIGIPKDGDLVNRALDMGYEVLVDADGLLVIMRYKVEAAASSVEMRHYDNIDVEKGILLSLPSLFKDDNYITVINQELLKQMKEREQNGDEIFYIYEDDGDGFQSIEANQTFYINKNHKLVISFDEYQIAPGYMGVVEFEIPTEVIKDELVSHYYVK